MESRPSEKLVLQRVRNRIIEYLETASSFEAQRLYQMKVPISVPNEMVNQWEDWVPDPSEEGFKSPVFSQEEREALLSFHQTWVDVAKSLPSSLPPLDETLHLPQWHRFRVSAEATLRVLVKRGRLPEEEEI
jgi:hypothetical protein